MTTLAHTPLIHIARWTDTQRAQAMAAARQYQRDLITQARTADAAGDTAQALATVEAFRLERSAYNTLKTINFN